MRTTKELRDKIDWAATASGRSLVQEVEFRLEGSFQQEEIEKLTDTVKLQVRLPERLRGLLEQAAKHKGHSINTEIFDRLDVSFQRENEKEMIEKAASDAVAAKDAVEEMIKKAARDAVQAQQEVTKQLLAAELGKTKHVSPPKGADPK